MLQVIDNMSFQSVFNEMHKAKQLAEAKNEFLEKRLAAVEEERDEYLERFKLEKSQHIRYNLLKAHVNKYDITNHAKLKEVKESVRAQARYLYKEFKADLDQKRARVADEEAACMFTHKGELAKISSRWGGTCFDTMPVELQKMVLNEVAGEDESEKIKYRGLSKTLALAFRPEAAEKRKERLANNRAKDLRYGGFYAQPNDKVHKKPWSIRIPKERPHLISIGKKQAARLNAMLAEEEVWAKTHNWMRCENCNAWNRVPKGEPRPVACSKCQ